jgi:ABC-2 type transport system permease protein
LASDIEPAEKGAASAAQEASAPTTPVRTTSARDAWYPAGKRDLFILRELVTKDFKLKYRRSVLGVIWSVLNPLLMMLVMSLVFSFFLRYDNIEHYPLYLIVANITWQVFADSTNAGMMSIIDAAPLLKKVRVKKTVFPVEKVLFSLVNFLFSLIAVVVVMLWEGVAPTPVMLLAPICIVLLMLFCVGLSLLLSALAVFFRDLIHLWSVLLMAWMYATPLFWPVSMIEQVPYHAVRVLMYVNPMYNFVTFMRDTVIYATIPPVEVVVSCVVWALVSLVLGYVVFRTRERRFILFI